MWDYTWSVSDCEELVGETEPAHSNGLTKYNIDIIKQLKSLMD